MTLRFVDSFDHYATANMGTKWTTVSSPTIGAGGRNGTNCLSFGSSNQVVSKVLDNQATWIVGFAFSATTVDVNGYILRFVDTAVEHVDLRFDGAARHLVVTRAGTVLGTGTTVLSSGVFYYIELKVTISDASGIVVLKINGSTELNLSSQDTRNAGNATANTIALSRGGGGVGVGYVYDDLYICDGQGSVNNDFLGDVRIQAILPSGAGNTTGWTPSAGSNYQNVDDATPNGDTDYNSTSTATTKDTYAFGDVTPTTGTVKGLQWLSYIRKDDAGSRSVCPVYRTGAADFDGATQNVLDSYTYLQEIKELNPNTTAAWTISEVNGAEFGIKLIA